MDRIRCILRARLWCCFLLCVLSVSAHSATRQHVPVATNAQATASTVPVVKDGAVIRSTVHSGEFIPAHKLDKHVPVTVEKRVDYSIPRTINHAKSLLKNNLAQALLAATVGAAVAGVGWIIEEGSQPVIKKPAEPGTYWEGHYYGGPYNYQSSHCNTVWSKGSSAAGLYSDATQLYLVTPANQPAWDSALADGFSPLASCSNLYVFKKPKPSIFNPAPGESVPITENDLDMLDPWMNDQSAEWLRDLLRETCAGSLDSNGCMQSLRDFHSLAGPATVPGKTQTTSSTYTKGDGTTGTRQTSTETTYNIKYGPTYFDYTENNTITHYEDGEQVGTETTTDGEEVTEEEGEKEEEQPMPCSSNCDGPEYVDQYAPTDTTKEQELDSYASKLQNIPIMSAVGDFFTVSVIASACPIWSYQGQLELPGASASMPIDLTFDFHCLPWFIDLKPWIQAIMALACTFIAIRIGLL